VKSLMFSVRISQNIGVFCVDEAGKCTGAIDDALRALGVMK
jgi:hypothetical protein